MWRLSRPIRRNMCMLPCSRVHIRTGSSTNTTPASTKMYRTFFFSIFSFSCSDEYRKKNINREIALWVFRFSLLLSTLRRHSDFVSHISSPMGPYTEIQHRASWRMRWTNKKICRRKARLCLTFPITTNFKFCFFFLIQTIFRLMNMELIWFGPFPCTISASRFDFVIKVEQQQKYARAESQEHWHFRFRLLLQLPSVLAEPIFFQN